MESFRNRKDPGMRVFVQQYYEARDPLYKRLRRLQRQTAFDEDDRFVIRTMPQLNRERLEESQAELHRAMDRYYREKFNKSYNPVMVARRPYSNRRQIVLVPVEGQGRVLYEPDMERFES